MSDYAEPTETAVVQQTVVGVRFTKVGKLYHFDYSGFSDLKAGDHVIVETLRGRQMGQVMGFTPADPDREHKPIMRVATPRDLVLRQHWQAKEPEALVICREKAAELGSFEEVKFVAAQYNYDGSNLTFLYSAEDKINVGRLLNELRRHFKQTHVEMRQIGPRDVAKLLGGYGACGELRCCSTFLTDFSPISIKMAKAQGISLNPTEITGMCGRLRCCLVYEYEQYVEARKQLPKRNKRIGTPLGEGKVIDVLPLQDSVVVYIEGEGRQTFKREDIIPIEEFEALKKKASEPCSKHGDDEPCECGQKPGTRNQDRVAAATDTASDDIPTAESQSTVDLAQGPDAESQSPGRQSTPGGDSKNRSRRSRSRRSKSKSGDKPTENRDAQGDEIGSSDSKPKSSRSRRSRGRRGKGKKPNDGTTGTSGSAGGSSSSGDNT